MEVMLTADGRAARKARAIETQRDLQADLERLDELHRYRENGQCMMISPSLHAWYLMALRDLQCAGEDIPDAMVRPPDTITWRPVKGVPLRDWIDGSVLLDDIACVMALVDPLPE